LKELNTCYQAEMADGTRINVKLIPLVKKQSTRDGFIDVTVGKQIQLETGEKIELNLDGKSFYFGPNQLYRIISS